MSNFFASEQTLHVGELDLFGDNSIDIKCDLVLIPEWKSRLPDFFR